MVMFASIPRRRRSGVGLVCRLLRLVNWLIRGGENWRWGLEMGGGLDVLRKLRLKKEEGLGYVDRVWRGRQTSKLLSPITTIWRRAATYGPMFLPA